MEIKDRSLERSKVEADTTDEIIKIIDRGKFDEESLRGIITVVIVRKFGSEKAKLVNGILQL